MATVTKAVKHGRPAGAKGKKSSKPKSFGAGLNARLHRLNKLEGKDLLREGAELLVAIVEETERLQQAELVIKVALGLRTLPE